MDDAFMMDEFGLNMMNDHDNARTYIPYEDPPLNKWLRDRKTNEFIWIRKYSDVEYTIARDRHGLAKKYTSAQKEKIIRNPAEELRKLHDDYNLYKKDQDNDEQYNIYKEHQRQQEQEQEQAPHLNQDLGAELPWWGGGSGLRRKRLMHKPVRTYKGTRAHPKRARKNLSRTRTRTRTRTRRHKNTTKRAGRTKRTNK